MRLRMMLFVVFAAALTGFLGCNKNTPPEVETTSKATGPAWFEDVTAKLGIDFQHDAGPIGPCLMPQIVGSGCAVFDCDGDGRLDLYFLNNVVAGSASKNRFFRQKADGTFYDASEGSPLHFAGPCMGTAVGDINNDGRPDLLVTMVGGLRLFLNLGEGKFADITEESQLRNPLWGTSAAFIDYDRDGKLDLFITNYVDYDPSFPCQDKHGRLDYCAPKTFAGTMSKLYRNLGAQGKACVQFEDVSVTSGIATLPGPGLGVYCADLTGDGWPDIFVANDGAPNRLWVNQRNGTFKDEAISRGIAYNLMGQAYAGMGVAVGDVDNDGLIDLYLTHLASETNTLWKQQPAGLFRDRTAQYGLTRTAWRGTGFGASMADFNHDGHLDIALVNGRVARGTIETPSGLPDFWQPYAQRNQILSNTGQKSFEDISLANPAFSSMPNVGRGLATADIDGDGAIDLITTSIAGPAKIYRNVCPNRGHWLQVRATDPTLNRDMYGAEVLVTCGEQRYFRIIHSTDSFLCSSSPIAHFGLDSRTQFDSITIKWPDGVSEKFAGGASDRSLHMRRGQGSQIK